MTSDSGPSRGRSPPAVIVTGYHPHTSADLGVLVARGRMQTEDGELTERCRRWIAGLRAGSTGMPVEPETSPIEHGPFAFKAPLERSVT